MHERLDSWDVEKVTLRLVVGADRIGIKLTDKARESLIKLIRLLHVWNKAYNLSAIRSPDDMVTLHLLDSIAVLPYIDGNTVLDFGTGAGFPGLPLAICDSSRHYWLLDANGKKIRFVRQAVLTLDIGNVHPVQSRIESYQPAVSFSTVICRAVGSLKEIAPLVQRLISPNGRLLIMKGRFPESELDDLEMSSVKIMVHSLAVPFVSGHRHLIEIRCH